MLNWLLGATWTKPKIPHSMKRGDPSDYILSMDFHVFGSMTQMASVSPHAPFLLPSFLLLDSQTVLLQTAQLLTA